MADMLADLARERLRTSPGNRVGLLTYVATILAALTLYGLIAAIPARLLARRPITAQLTYE